MSGPQKRSIAHLSHWPARNRRSPSGMRRAADIISVKAKSAVVSVSTGMVHSCGVKTDSSVVCWGANVDSNGNYIGQATPPSGSFTSVSAGGFHSCGVKTDSSVVCWGANVDIEGNYIGQARPPR